uniref:Uncharacterized protein n=1 Tax=Clytia hemisphaerica TaxID=252671 RepID=A0A7M5WVS4_9CNID|eukprot:TCONS_00068804-protein
MSIRISEEPPKNKEEFLQSRIDQQVELICILKQRADEYLQKYLTNEEQVKTLRNDLEKTQNEHSSEVEKCKLLKRNISELEERWKKVKDQNGGLEQENVGLRNRCRELEENNEELNTQCEKLKVELEDIPGACAEKMRKLDEDLQQQLNQSQDVARKFQEKLSKRDEKLKILKDDLKNLSQEYSALKEKFEDSQNKSNENMKIREISEQMVSRLQQDLQTTRNDLDNAKRVLRDEQSRSSKERETLKKEYLALQQQLPSYVFEKERQSMKQDLNAYKDHAQKLLNREQELNAKLRRLSPKSFKK